MSENSNVKSDSRPNILVLPDLHAPSRRIIVPPNPDRIDVARWASERLRELNSWLRVPRAATTKRHQGEQSIERSASTTPVVPASPATPQPWESPMRPDWND